jgi:hypothetical protein
MALSPDDLRDLAGVFDDYVSGSAGTFGQYLCEVAARREAEATLQDVSEPLWRAAVEAGAAGEREGPGSAAEPIPKRDGTFYTPAPPPDQTIGVGDGSGQLFVRGDYESVKAVQKLIHRVGEQSLEIARLREAGLALLAEETVTVQTGYDNGPGGGNYVYSEAVRTDSAAFKKFRNALKGASDA